MTWRKALRTIGVCVLVMLLTGMVGCRGRGRPGGEEGDEAAPPAPKALIGVLLPLSGESKSQGEALVAGLKHALRHKGAALGIAEASLEIKDYGDSLADIPAHARYLLEWQDVPVLLGPIAPRGVEMIEELARQRKTAVLTTTSVPMKLSVVESTVWRLTFDDEQEGRALADFAVAKRFRGAAVVVDSKSPSSEMRAKGFGERFAELGGTVLSQVSYVSGETDFRRLIRMAAERKPDVLYLTGGGAESTAIVQEMKRQGVFGSVFGSTDWDTDARFPVEVGAGAGVYAPCRFHRGRSSMVTIEFVKTFKEATGHDPGALEALGYDAGLVALEAVSRAKERGSVVADEIAGLKLFTGATGRLAARRWSLAGEVVVLRLREGSFVFETSVEVK